MSIGFALITFYSCSLELEHLEPVTQQDRDIHAAKLWFEENQGEISSVIHEGTHSLRISKEPYVKNPNWGLVNKHVNADGQEVIEVNLTFNKSMAPNAFLEKTTEKDQSPIMLQNLLLTSDGKGGYDTYLLKIFAFSDKNVKNKKALFQSLNYGHLEKGFSGSILLTSYQEELFKRWEFSDGFLISEANPIPDSHKRPKLANFSYSCEIVDTSYCEVESDGVGYGATITCGGGLEYQCTITDSPSSPHNQFASLDPNSGGGGGGGESEQLEIKKMNCLELKNDHNEPRNDVINFMNSNRGKTYNEIISQRENRSWSFMDSQQGGPSIRYISDPLNPNIIIDLRHLLIVGKLGRAAGESIEIIQAISGNPSGYDDQDFYSNELGYSFFQYYGGAVKANPTATADYLASFLNDPRKRNSISTPERCK